MKKIDKAWIIKNSLDLPNIAENMFVQGSKMHIFSILTSTKFMVNSALYWKQTTNHDFIKTFYEQIG